LNPKYLENKTFTVIDIGASTTEISKVDVSLNKTSKEIFVNLV
jgi:hypothetical protein